jgi:UDP-GlcNAc3NAcA epimerase
VPARLRAIFNGLKRTAKEHGMKVVLPLHPRTKKCMATDPELRSELVDSQDIIILPPASFFDMIVLESNASIVMTDSGGVQKEAFFFNRPCVIFRSETEWVELVDCEAAILADADSDRIVEAAKTLLRSKIEYPSIFGDGRAAEFICREMIRHLGK